MPDAYVIILLEPGDQGAQARYAKAIRAMRARFDGFPDVFAGSALQWWMNAPEKRARSLLARCLSKYGLRGQVSVVPHPGGDHPWDKPPVPRFTGFMPRKWFVIHTMQMTAPIIRVDRG